MSDAFWTGLWTNLPAIITALGGFGLTFYMNWRTGQKAAARGEAIKNEVAAVKTEVAAVKETAQLSEQTIDLVKTGAYRLGHVAGDAKGYQRAQTDFGGLQAQATDYGGGVPTK